MIDTCVRERLLGCAPVTALVAQRVYVQILPEHPTLPAICVRFVGQDEPMHARGPISKFKSRVQVDSIGTTRETAEAVDAAVQGDGLGDTATGLKGWRGQTGSPSLKIDGVSPGGVQLDFDAPPLRNFRIMRDFMIVFNGVQ